MVGNDKAVSVSSTGTNPQYTLKFQIGTSGINRGIYDSTKGNWMIHRDATDTYINGINVANFLRKDILNGNSSFVGLQLGTFGDIAYIYSNNSNINFRYKNSAGATVYTNINDIINSLAGKSSTSHTHTSINGRSVTDAVGVNTIVTRNPQGYSYMNYINCNTPSGENPAIGNFIVTNNGDNAFFRKASVTHVKNTLKVPTFTLSGSTLTITVP